MGEGYSTLGGIECQAQSVLLTVAENLENHMSPTYFLHQTDTLALYNREIIFAQAVDSIF